MSPPEPEPVAGLAAIARDPGHALLAFDFDGVLSPIVDDPEAAQAFPPVLPVLAALGASVGTIAIITGRPVSFVTSRAGIEALLSIPGFAIYGQYGRERWDSASRTVMVEPGGDGVAAIRAELTRLLEQPGVGEGTWLEDKGSALAVHTRRAADPLGTLAVLSKPIDDLARRHQLRVEPGKMVLEVRPAGREKGDVLRALVAERGARSVLYAGDDLGDLSAFAAIDELRAGGLPGVKVCSASPEDTEVVKAADLVVDGPPGVTWLLGDLGRQIAAA
jgi:trehalose 6-phosphate phosphatase